MLDILNLEEILNLLEKNDIKALEAMLQEKHPVDIAEIYNELPYKYCLAFFKTLDFEIALEVLENIDTEKKYYTLTNIETKYAVDFMEQMSSDIIADFVGELEDTQKVKIIALVNKKERKKLKGLLSYPIDSAGGLMTTEYIAFPKYMKAKNVINALEGLAPDAETIYYIYVIDSKERLVGVISLRDLILADKETPIEEFMIQSVKKIKATLDQEEVAKYMNKYGFLALPVVDEKGVLLGIITVDDVMPVFEEEVTEDILKLAGSGETIDTETTSPWDRAKRRLPWIIICILGELLSGKVINNYSNSLKTVIALAFFIPVLMDMGGNVGTQSAAIVVRGLATGKMDTENFGINIFREGVTGALLGAFNGILLAIIAILWQKDMKLAYIVGLSMAFNLTFAAILGTCMPFLWHKRGQDPAVASGPLVTTILDIVGLFIYFSVATCVYMK